MNTIYDSLPSCGTGLHQLFDIMNKDHTGIVGIENARTSSPLVASHLSTGSMRSDDGPGASLSQCFSRLAQKSVFDFLDGIRKVEELPCLGFSGNKELHGFNKKVPTLEKDRLEIIHVKDAVHHQISIFNFLNGDIHQCLVFLMDFDLKSEKMAHQLHSKPDSYEGLRRHFSVLDLSSSSDGSVCIDDTRRGIQKSELCSEISRQLHVTNPIAYVHNEDSCMINSTTAKDDSFTGEIERKTISENAIENFATPKTISPTHFYQESFEDASLSDCDVEDGKLGASQCSSIGNFSGMLSKLNCNAGIFQRTINCALENYGSVDENNYEETAAGIPILPSSESIPPISVHNQFDEELSGSSASTMYYHEIFDNVSDNGWSFHNSTSSQYGDSASSNEFGLSKHRSSQVFGTFDQYPSIENTEMPTFSIPDPEELMMFLQGALNSPSFLMSDLLKAESNHFHFSSHPGYRNSDEAAESEYLSDTTANSSSEATGNDNEDGFLDFFGISNESQIGAMTGASREIETYAIPSQEKAKKICGYWSRQEDDTSAFDFDDHQDLMEMYGLSEQDGHVYDDNTCESPTWPGKQ